MSTLSETAQLDQGRLDPEERVVMLPQGGVYFSVPLVLNLGALELTDEQLLAISTANGDLQIELTADGELVIMPPTGEPSGWKENELAFQVTLWTRQAGTGLVFGAAAGFRLPNGAVRAPGVSWILRERWDAWLSTQTHSNEEREEGEEGKDSFPNLCPDFVLELRSPSDTLASVQRKLEEYMVNGTRLGWLIDPLRRQAHIYRPGQDAEVLDEPESLAGDPVLPGFVLNLAEIW